MAGLVDRLTRAAVRRGLRQGLFAGDGKWLALGAVAWLVRLLRKRHEPEVVVEQLRRGESILVTNIGPQHGRAARKARRAEQDGQEGSAPARAGRLDAAKGG